MQFQDHGAAMRMTARRSIEHRTISSAVTDDLRQRILSGELESGLQLRQDQLAAEFGVSRIPIREALMQLEAEGLVKLSPHRGATVSSPSLDEIQEVFELRGMLEPMLLMASAPRLTREDFTVLEGLLEEYASNMEANNVQIWASSIRRCICGSIRRPGDRVPRRSC